MIDSWDVVNEPFSDGASQFRKHPVLDEFGDAFIRFLFLQARRLAPEAKLVLNDYNLSCGAGFCQRKRDHALFAIERLLKSGTHIDAIGIQAHLLKRWPVRKTSLSTFVRGLDDLGLDVHISEMDVNDVDMPTDIARRDALIAEIYGDYLSAVLEHRSVEKGRVLGSQRCRALDRARLRAVPPQDGNAETGAVRSGIPTEARIPCRCGCVAPRSEQKLRASGGDERKPQMRDRRLAGHTIHDCLIGAFFAPGANIDFRVCFAASLDVCSLAHSRRRHTGQSATVARGQAELRHVCKFAISRPRCFRVTSFTLPRSRAR